MAETNNDFLAEAANYATIAPRSVSSDSHFSFPNPQMMQPASQNYRRSPKSSPTNSTEISNDSRSAARADVETGWPSPATQPGAFMIPMRAVGARPGWATTNRRSWTARIPSFMQSFRSRNSADSSTDRMEMHEVAVVQDATLVVQNDPVIVQRQDTAPVQQDNSDIMGDPKHDEQCRRKLTWAHIAILGLIFGAIIAAIVWFVVNGKDSQKSQSHLENGTQANDPLASGQPFNPSSSEFLAAKEAYLPLVLAISKEDDFDDPSSSQSKALIWLAASAPIDPQTKQPPLPEERLLTRYALAVLYYSTKGDSWQNSLGFLDTDTDECDWNIPLNRKETFEEAGHVVNKLGVHCTDKSDDDSERRVEILNLGNNNLAGEFPDSEMNALEHLKVGIFSNNSISGSLPTQWKPRSMVHLDFSFNKLSSAIPSMLLTHSSKLKNLLLSANKLHGTLASEIGQATNLRVLALDNNGLEGSLPAELSQLQQLEELILEQNKFSRQLPTDIGRITSLANLNLNHNIFTGYFPWEDFGNRTNCTLMSLNLASNSFVGAIPWDILSTNTAVGWTCLQALTLKSSGFTAETLPDTVFGNWVDTLKHLDLSDTLMRGSIPTTISSLSKLELLDLGINGLTGTFPMSIVALENLRYLNLYFNSLEGPIPSEIGEMSNLLKIDMMGNRFNRTIPESLGDLSSLEILHLRQNELTGTVPASLSKLNNLTILTVSINNLAGSMDEFCNSGQEFYDLSSDCLEEVACTCCTTCHR